MGNQTSSTTTSNSNNVKEVKKASSAAASQQQQSSFLLHENLTVTENPLVAGEEGRRDVFDDKYEKVKHVADGSSCQIYLVRRKKTSKQLKLLKSEEQQSESKSESSASSPLYALKVIQKSATDDRFLQEMKTEVKILKRLDHPNIVRIYDLFETESELYLVMEYCSGGNLMARAPYTEPQVAKLMTKLLSAVDFMHKNKVVHRDLKIDNCMFENSNSEAEPKVIDFGLSKPYFDDEAKKSGSSSSSYKMTCRVGTLETMSPQVLKGSYTDKADIWSLGVIAYMLLSNGKAPFQGSTTKEIAANIISEKYHVRMDDETDPTWNSISKEAKSFVKSLLEYDPSKRKTAAAALRSSWLTKHYDHDDDHPTLDEQQAQRTSTPEEAVQKMNSIRSAVWSSAKNDGIFKRVSNMIIAHKLSSESVAELRDAFHAMDTNHQGTINYWEFRTALKQSCDFSDRELKEAFRGIDVNDTGVVSMALFSIALLLSF